MTLAADPDSLQGAIAAGILGAGRVILGTSQECAALLQDAKGRVDGGGATPADAATAVAREVHEAGRKLPGFGHPVHDPVDPRAERVLELADARGVAGEYVGLAQELRAAAAAVWGRPLTMNVSLPIAAVLLDLDFPAAAVKAIPILARTAGLLAHLAEEQADPLGFVLASAAEHVPPSG
jgi:citrate synthase